MNVYVPPPKKVSKTTLSMFLRTHCDKELFLSLHEGTDLQGAGMPIPITRAGIGRLARAGAEFEQERNEQLVRMMGSAIGYSRGPKGVFSQIDLAAHLGPALASPTILLQPHFSLFAQQRKILLDLGLDAADAGLIPPLSDFKPDLIIVRAHRPDDTEVLLSGGRRQIDDLVEIRQALVVLDVKHTSEANTSYCSEVALYSSMLAHWLAARPALAARYFVAGNAYLWSRSKVANSAVDQLETAGGGTPAQVLQAIESDVEDTYLRLYLPVVRQFFENVARVIRIADLSNTGWGQLAWHVMGSCGGCDWLGDKRHIDRRDHAKVDANPDHYCLPRARAESHLSLVPGITRGAKRTLEMHAIPDATTLSTSPGHAAFQHHTVLKREARNLPAVCNAILTSTLASDAAVRIASLDDYPELKLYVAINFDPSSGLLTGLSVCGSASTYTAGVAPRRFAPMPFIVDQKTATDEWTALDGFLNQIAQCTDQAETFVGQPPTGQIHFWDERQFHELCHAMGRHLPRVLTLATRRARALAWLFPADDLLPHPDSLDASTIACIADIVRRAIFTPTAHAVTLFGTSEHYSSGPVITERDSYYREYLTDGIPRERIYEIWSNLLAIPRGGAATIPRNTAIVRYAQTLSTQVRALESVCERLRTDYRGQFRAKAPRIPTSIPRGANRVAFDAKLWIWWDNLEFQAMQLEAHIRLGLDGERLEASYEAIVLQNGRSVGGDLYEFDVPVSSLEAKFTEDAILTLGKLGRPGLPLERARALIAPGAPPYNGPQDLLVQPLWSALEVHLRNFDRIRRIAQVEVTCWRDQGLVTYLLSHSTEDLLDQVFLLESKRPRLFNWSINSAKLLEAIGIPPIAQPDPNAATAMGMQTRAQRGTDPSTPAAQVLWDAGTLSQTRRLAPPTAAAIARMAQQLYHLDPSQTAAVDYAAAFALTVIWGPPGTGKTNTLAAFVHALVRDAVSRGVALRILIAGPTYKAVSELINRSIDGMVADTMAPCDIFMGYSAGRLEAPRTGLPAHLTHSAFPFSPSTDPSYQSCLQALIAAPARPVMVGAHIRQARRFADALHGTAVGPVFDVVILDESSQIPVSHALSALVTLADEGRVVIAGDQLQMPPITALDPPEQAAYLVGSVQTYLLRRPFTPSVVESPLDNNYRSADKIVRYLHRIGYRSSLTSVHPNTALHFVAPLPTSWPPGLPSCPDARLILDPSHPVVTFLHEDHISSQGNLIEAQFVAGLVWMMRQCVSTELNGRGPVTHRLPSAQEFWGQCMGVVTPHRAQRALVVRELQLLFPAEATLIQEAVDTVERFQGGQRHTIIVTFGVADVEVITGEEAFLMQQERMNVAVSRAQAKCIVLMPQTLAAHIPEDRRALITAHAVKEYVECYCDARLSTSLVIAGIYRPAEIRYAP